MPNTDACKEKPDDDYGRDRYLTIGGVRYLTKHVRTVQPDLNESNDAFRERMDRFAERLSESQHVRLVEHDFERRKKKFVLCVFEITYEPHIPVEEPADETPAGGRHGHQRYAA